MDRSKVVNEAKRILPECDYIIDLYDFHFFWASEYGLDISGYKMEEIYSISNLDLIDENRSEADLRKELVERIAKGEGDNEYDIIVKNGRKLHVKIHYKIFSYEGGQYLVGKVNKVEIRK